MTTARRRAAVAAVAVVLAGCGSGHHDEPPAILIDTPSDQDTWTTTARATLLAGSTFEATRTVRWVNAATGASGQVGASTFCAGILVVACSTSWRVYDVALVPGDNPLTVTALGATGAALGEDRLLVLRAADAIAPSVVSTSPAPGASGVPVATTVGFTFSEPVEGPLIGPAQSSTFQLLNVATQVPIDGMLRYDPGMQTAMFTPAAPLAAATAYRATVADVRDLAGNALPPPGYSWTFSTAP